MNKHIDYKNVLVISHNPFSLVSNNGKTLSSIFNEWPTENLANLYFQNDIPDYSVCKKYFKITDEDILFKRKSGIGKEIQIDNTEVVKKSVSPFHLYIRKNPLQIYHFARNIIWLFKRWNNRKLSIWIKQFKPQIIFLMGGSSAFAYIIAKNISDKYNSPIYLYYTDDYITPNMSVNIFWWMNYILLRVYLKKALFNVKKVFVIGDDMAKEYVGRLKKKCIPIMNSIEIDKYYEKENVSNNSIDVNNIGIAYFGALHLNRWKTIVKIGSSIRKISNENSVKIYLSIYSYIKPSDKIIEIIEKSGHVEYKGSVDADNIIAEMQKYDIMLHVESFEKKMIRKTRLSISTKIPEYLACGRPILAIGPENVSSIKYLKRINIGYICESNQNIRIEKALYKIIDERKILYKIGEKGKMYAKINHNININKELIKNILCGNDL